jgi:NAD(P)-dependent dehydrogenase (short-subunit alcohol dehydrogenase family)
MKTIVITGSQTGMGYATRQLLEAVGVRVIGVSNVGDAEVIADLSTDDGVDDAIAGIEAMSQGQIDGVFANAGVDSENARLVFGLNYFGIVRMLETLRPSLARSGEGRVVVNASNSVVITPGIPQDVVDALVSNDRLKAIALIAAQPQWTYQVSKAAITRWVRTHATSPQWAGSGISMNVLAPGVVMTALIGHDLKDPRKAAGIQGLPKPLGSVPGPQHIAPLVKFLLVEDARFIVGQFLIIDGGTEAAWRGADAPRPWDITTEEFGRLLRRSS